MRLLLPPAGAAEAQDSAWHWTASDQLLAFSRTRSEHGCVNLLDLRNTVIVRASLTCAHGMVCTLKKDAVFLMLQEARPWDERMARAVAVMLHRCCHTSLLQVRHQSVLLDVKVCRLCNASLHYCNSLAMLACLETQVCVMLEQRRCTDAISSSCLGAYA